MRQGEIVGWMRSALRGVSEYGHCTTLTHVLAQIPETKWKIGTMWRDAGAHNEEARRFRDALPLDIRP